MSSNKRFAKELVEAAKEENFPFECKVVVESSSPTQVKLLADFGPGNPIGHPVSITYDLRSFPFTAPVVMVGKKFAKHPHCTGSNGQYDLCGWCPLLTIRQLVCNIYVHFVLGVVDPGVKGNNTVPHLDLTYRVGHML